MSGIDTEANALLLSLTTDLNVSIPVIDLDNALLRVPTQISDAMYVPVVGPEVADLTTRTVGGSGVFDALMASTSAHLKAEFDKGRITGAEYTKAYVEIVAAAMQNAVQFLLSKKQAFWQAQQAQIEAITARVQLEINKVNLAKVRIDAATAEVAYATGKAQLAIAGIQHDTAQFNLATVLPAQVALTNAQTALAGAQLTTTAKQTALLQEQTEVQRAQTMDTRTDGLTAVTGVLGKQKALYAQQTTSYQRDAEVKAAKLFTDAWTVQKTVDDGLTPPTGFTNSSLDTVLTAIKNNNNLV